MAWLLVDNSNTRTKFALADCETLLPTRDWLPTPEIAEATLKTTLEEFVFEGTLLCSVVPEKARILLQMALSKGADLEGVRRIFNEY